MQPQPTTAQACPHCGDQLDLDARHCDGRCPWVVCPNNRCGRVVHPNPPARLAGEPDDGCE